MSLKGLIKLFEEYNLSSKVRIEASDLYELLISYDYEDNFIICDNKSYLITLDSFSQEVRDRFKDLNIYFYKCYDNFVSLQIEYLKNSRLIFNFTSTKDDWYFLHAYDIHDRYDQIDDFYRCDGLDGLELCIRNYINLRKNNLPSSLVKESNSKDDLWEAIPYYEYNSDLFSVSDAVLFDDKEYRITNDMSDKNLLDEIKSKFDVNVDEHEDMLVIFDKNMSSSYPEITLSSVEDDWWFLFDCKKEINYRCDGKEGLIGCIGHVLGIKFIKESNSNKEELWEELNLVPKTNKNYIECNNSTYNIIECGEYLDDINSVTSINRYEDRFDGIHFYGSKSFYEFTMWLVEDDWWFLNFYNCINNEETWYKCDGIEGLLKCLRDNLPSGLIKESNSNGGMWEVAHIDSNMEWDKEYYYLNGKYWKITDDMYKKSDFIFNEFNKILKELGHKSFKNGKGESYLYMEINMNGNYINVTSLEDDWWVLIFGEDVTTCKCDGLEGLFVCFRDNLPHFQYEINI